MEASERFLTPPVFPKDSLSKLSDVLARFAKSIPGVAVRGSPARRLTNTVAFTVEGCDSIALLAGLDMSGFCASSGSACSAGALEPSHVLTAMGIDKQLAASLIRFSLGRDSSLAEVDRVQEILPFIIDRVRHS